MRTVLVSAICVLALQTGLAQAGVITDGDIWATTGNEIQAGNGLLDFVLFNGSVAGDANECDGFNGDDANTDMPHGGGTAAAESYITSIGELRAFYTICDFPEEFKHNLRLSVDLNEEGSAEWIYLSALTIVIDYDPVYGDGRDDPASCDISSAEQNMTNAMFGGGETAAWLDYSPKRLDVNEQGAGWADFVITTGIDPFDPAYTDSTRILIHWASYDHTNGSDTVFISSYIPEPSALSLLALGSLAVLRRKRT